MVRPEKCHYAKGTCRQPVWGEQNCFAPHYIYLANTSGVKVGITRNIPQRWLDQGATQALPIIKVNNRFDAGKLEIIFKQFIADKTNWRKMLSGNAKDINLQNIAYDLLKQIGNTYELLPNLDTIKIKYPVLYYPTKIKSLNFDKTAEISGKLYGIKGQYLILDIGVLNLRKFKGYEIFYDIGENSIKRL
jgi:hypothetical protein